jgi:hypothetical protein
VVVGYGAPDRVPDAGPPISEGPILVRRSLSLALATILFAGFAVACGDDDDAAGGTTSPENFCAQAERLDEQFAAMDEDDPAVMQDAVAAMRGMSVPEEIREDWTVMTEGLEAIAEAFAGIDPEDPQAALEAMGEIDDLEAQFEGVDEASERVEAYLQDECGLDFE